MTMKKTLMALVACTCAFGLQAAEKTVTVAEGETVMLDAALAAAGLTLENGDVLVKMGAGRLRGSATYKNVSAPLRIVEGVYEAQAAEEFFSGGAIAVRDGATLDVNWTGKSGDYTILGGRNLYLAGAGSPAAAVTENGRTLTGALLLRGTENAYQIMSNMSIYTDHADATIASVAKGMTGYLSSGTLVTYDKTITLLGPGHSFAEGEELTASTQALYQHRYRYGNGFGDGTGRLVIDGAVLTAHNIDNYSIGGGARPVTVKNGGGIGFEGPTFAKCFSFVDFEWGTFVAPGNGALGASFTMPAFSGLPAFSIYAQATINDKWIVDAGELVQGHVLVAHRNPLTFGANARLTVTNLTALTVGETYTVARAAGGITGAPALVPESTDAQRWRVASDGTALTLAYVVPTGDNLVDVRTWGVAAGTDAATAAANSAALAAGLAAAGDGALTVFFPMGAYAFAEPLALPNRTAALTLLGDNGTSRLMVADTAAAVVTAAGGPAVTVTGLTLAGGAGVAVDATGVASLVVTNNVFKDVPGTRAGTTNTAAVVAANCTAALVRANRVAGGDGYTEIVAAMGTTTLDAACSPSTAEVVLNADVPADDIYRARPFAEALAEVGLAAYPQGARLVKTGLGKMDAPTNATLGARLGPITVREGTLVSVDEGRLGPQGNTIRVEDGATILLNQANGTSCAARRYTFNLGGNGATATFANAAFCVRGQGWEMSDSCTYELRSDVTFNFVSGGNVNCGLFSYATLAQNGHTLTLKGWESNGGRDKVNARFRLYTLFKAPMGPLVADGLTVSASYKDAKTAGFSGENGERPPLLKIKSNARLQLNNQDFADVFALYDFEAGAELKAESANMKLTTANLAGAPTIVGTATLTVTNRYTARASDLLKGAMLTANGAVVFGPNCTLVVEGVETLPTSSSTSYVLATSATAMTVKPRNDPSLAAAGWTTELADGGASLLLRRFRGLTLIIR